MQTAKWMVQTRLSGLRLSFCLCMQMQTSIIEEALNFH